MNNKQFRLAIVVFSIMLINGLAFNGCSNNNDSSLTNVVVLDAPIKQQIRTESLDLNQLYEEITIVELEDNEGEDLIGIIRDIKSVDKYIFVCDERAIHIYDINGSFVSVIDRRGRGRGEYLSLSCFDIDKESRRIIIYDSTQKKLLYYSYDGSFIKEQDCNGGLLISEFAVLQNGEFIFYYNHYDDIGNRGLWLADSNGIFKQQLIDFNESYRSAIVKDKYLVHINDNSIGYIGDEDKNVINTIVGDSIVKEYQIKCDIKIPKRLMRKKLLSDNDMKKIFFKGGYLETDNTLFFDMVTGDGNGYTMIVDKLSNKAYRIYDNKDIIVSGEAKIVPNFRFSDHNKLIGFYLPTTILKYEILRNRFPNINEDSNPVLFLVTTKSIH